MKYTERVAKQLLEHCIAGARVEFKDEQANGEHDFDLYAPDGVRAVVEVTASVDQRYVESRRAISSPSKGGVFVPGALVTSSWYVHLTQSARVNEVRKKIDAMLAAVEATGVTEFFAPTDSYDNESIKQIWTVLGVEHGRITNWKHGKFICLGSPGQSTCVSATHILLAVNRALSKKDNLRKLSQTDGSKSHLFLWIDSSSYDAWAAMQRRLVPAASPKLPAMTSDIWVAATVGPGETVRIIHFVDDAWVDLGEIALPASE